LRLFRAVGFDAVYATGSPWSSLLVGRDIARQTGVPFVADFRDPWAGDDVFLSHLSATRRRRELALERSVVDQADAVVSVSDAMTELMRAIHANVPASRFVTIHNGYDPADLATCEAQQRSGKFRVVYTGNWAPDYNPGALYTAVERLESAHPDHVQNLEIVAAGFAPGEAARRRLSHLIREVGPVSHPSALGWMQSADALFLTVAGGAYQTHHLPGKLFEYLGTRRPIIAMADPEGETGRLIRRIGGGVVIPWNDSELLARTLFDAMKAGNLRVTPQDLSALAAFERSALAERLAGVLDSVQRH
jgi:hypothetical protein